MTVENLEFLRFLCVDYLAQESLQVGFSEHMVISEICGILYLLIHVGHEFDSQY